MCRHCGQVDGKINFGNNHTLLSHGNRKEARILSTCVLCVGNLERQVGANETYMYVAVPIRMRSHVVADGASAFACIFRGTAQPALHTLTVIYFFLSTVALIWVIRYAAYE